MLCETEKQTYSYESMNRYPTKNTNIWCDHIL